MQCILNIFYLISMNRFASRARNIKNKPELNEVMSDGVLLKRYARQIDILHTELEVHYYKCLKIFFALLYKKYRKL